MAITTAGKPQAHKQYLRRVFLVFWAGWKRAQLSEITLKAHRFLVTENLKAISKHVSI